MNDDINRLLKAFCDEHRLTPSELLTRAQALCDEDFRSTYGSYEEKIEDIKARMKNAREDAKRRRSSDVNFAAKIEGIRHARTLFGSSLREAKDLVEGMLARGEA